MLDLTRAYGLTFIVPSGDQVVGWSLRAFGEFAKPEVDLLAAYIEHSGSGGVFVDVGANVGAVSLHLAKRFPDWSFVAIEAHRGLSGIFAANVLNNQLENVSWHHAAAGAKPGLGRFPAVSLDSRTNFGSLGAYMNDSVATETVRVAPLDELAPAATRVVKIDVEGAELEVLRGASKLLAQTRPAVLFEVKRQDKPAAAELFEIFRQHGYRQHLMFAPFATPAHPKAGGAPAALSGDFNMLALPEGAPNLWDLPEMHDPLGDWPASVTDFGYLLRYGYKSE
jgi:FkbM family methyltransferase